jgi:hypothetical protein
VSEDAAVTEEWADPDPRRAWQPDTEAYDLGTLPPWEPPPRVPLWQRVRPHLVTFAATTVALVLLGAPLAFVWRQVAKPAVVLRTASGPSPAAPETNQVFAVDGRYVVVMLVAGLLLGCVLWALLRRRGPAAPLAMAAGGLLASLVTAGVGRKMVVDSYLYRFCHQGDVHCLVYDGTLRLHALAAVVVLPAAMLIAFSALAVFFDREGYPA